MRNRVRFYTRFSYRCKSRRRRRDVNSVFFFFFILLLFAILFHSLYSIIRILHRTSSLDGLKAIFGLKNRTQCGRYTIYCNTRTLLNDDLDARTAETLFAVNEREIINKSRANNIIIIITCFQVTEEISNNNNNALHDTDHRYNMESYYYYYIIMLRVRRIRV